MLLFRRQGQRDAGVDGTSSVFNPDTLPKLCICVALQILEQFCPKATVGGVA